MRDGPARPTAARSCKRLGRPDDRPAGVAGRAVATSVPTTASNVASTTSCHPTRSPISARVCDRLDRREHDRPVDAADAAADREVPGRRLDRARPPRRPGTSGVQAERAQAEGARADREPRRRLPAVATRRGAAPRAPRAVNGRPRRATMVTATETTTTIDKDALKAKYREERDKRLRPDGNDQYLRLKGKLAHYLDDPYTPVVDARAADRPRHRRVHRRRLRRARHRRAARRRRASTTSASSRRAATSAAPGTGTATRARSATRPAFVYMPLLEETGHMPTREVRPRAGDPRALPADREAVRPLRQRAVPHRGHRPRVGRRPLALDRPHQPGRRVHRAVRRHGHRPAARARSCRASPGSRRSRATRSTPAGGTTTTPAATRTARRWTSWPTSGWRSSAPARPPCSASRTSPVPQGALRLPAHAVVGRRPRQPADRPGVVRRDRHAGLAAALARELHRQPDRRCLAEEDLVQDGWTDIARRIRSRRSVASRPRTSRPRR